MVRVWDLTDGAAPKLAGENTIAVAGFTPDVSQRVFPKAKELMPLAGMTMGHVNYQGIGFNFAVDTSGLTMYGSRIYLHSPSMLICIGER